MSGGRRTTETTNQNYNNQENINTGPWGPQQPFIQDMFGEAQRLYNQGPQQYYPGQTYVDPSQYTMQGIYGLANLPGVQQDPLYGLASGFIGNSLNSIPQIGGIQDYLGAQLDPNTQMRAPVPGYAPQPSQGYGGPVIPGGGGGSMSMPQSSGGFQGPPGGFRQPQFPYQSADIGGYAQQFAPQFGGSQSQGMMGGGFQNQALGPPSILDGMLGGFQTAQGMPNQRVPQASGGIQNAYSQMMGMMGRPQGFQTAQGMPSQRPQSSGGQRNNALQAMGMSPQASGGYQTAQGMGRGKRPQSSSGGGRKPTVVRNSQRKPAASRTRIRARRK